MTAACLIPLSSPSSYSIAGSPLFGGVYTPSHAIPVIIDADWGGCDHDISDELFKLIEF